MPPVKKSVLILGIAAALAASHGVAYLAGQKIRALWDQETLAYIAADVPNDHLNVSNRLLQTAIKYPGAFKPDELAALKARVENDLAQVQAHTLPVAQKLGKADLEHTATFAVSRSKDLLDKLPPQ